MIPLLTVNPLPINDHVSMGWSDCSFAALDETRRLLGQVLHCARGARTSQNKDLVFARAFLSLVGWCREWNESLGLDR